MILPFFSKILYPFVSDLAVTVLQKSYQNGEASKYIPMEQILMCRHSFFKGASRPPYFPTTFQNIF